MNTRATNGRITIDTENPCCWKGLENGEGMTPETRTPVDEQRRCARFDYTFREIGQHLHSQPIPHRLPLISSRECAAVSFRLV